MPPEDDPPSVLDEALDRLYAVPPDDFVRVRKELAAELKERGEKIAAKRVLEAKKPTRATWALNQVARRAPELLSEYVEARAAAQEAQSGSDSDGLRASLERYRKSAAEVVGAAEEAMRGAGAAPSPQERRQITESLDAAGTDTSFLRARLLGGRLEKRAVVVDPLAALGSKAPAAAPRVEKEHAEEEAQAKAKAQAEAEAQAEAKAQAEAQARAEARAREVNVAAREVASLEAAVEDARAKRREADARAKAAGKAVEEAEAKLEAARGKLRALREG